VLTTSAGAANVRALVPRAPVHPAHRSGLLAGAGCFLFWGLVPIFWKQLGHVDAVELVAQRTVWSLLFLLVVLASQARLRVVLQVFTSRRLLAVNALTGALLMGNWLAFLWAIGRGQLLEASLGYFLVPLFHVAAGALLHGERPRPLQWLAIALAAVGVGWLIVAVGHLPWMALLIAVTWALYGVVRKRSPMPALDGLAVETLLFTPPALGWLVVHGGGALARGGFVDALMLVSSGWITAIPLVWFAFAAARIPLTTLGLLQYLSPSIQFVLGWLVYRESFDGGRAQGFAWIWAGLLVYVLEGLRHRRASGMLRGAAGG
jgi:chloramphenicol-sensitive protein RarD